ncbi:MAG: ABC-F family ATP-binding cassette domain-containing protein [Lutisporaceae bacterium]
MNLISIENISKAYSEKKLLDNINLGINEGDKIGVIGINGVGKSTLLKIIAGVEQSDEGRLIKGNAVRVEYLSQNPYFDNEATVLEQVFKGNSAIMRLIRDYEQSVRCPNTSPEKLMKLNTEMDTMNAWNMESEAKGVLTKLGVEDFEAKISTLSGGQKKRIMLASALINPSDLLILDEPTNHLDNTTIDWLEEFLNKRKGALLMITHDRYFLDRVVNEILEVERGNLYLYKGNYSSFLEKKLEREERDASSEKKRQGLLKKELAWIRKGAKARTTKQKARIDRFDKLSEKITELEDEKLDISVGSSRLGKKIIELEHVSKAFDTKKVIDDFSYIVLRNDRVGIIGPNGSGKSTLVNIIAGTMQPDAGSIEIGETVKIGLFSQESYHMDEKLRVIEYIKEGAEFLTTAEGEKISASQMLERFLFDPGSQWTPISKLSGGEKRRLHLLRVLMEAPNILLLDEPTNDLDIETLNVLEDYIENFLGAVIAVSHDRYFIDKVTDKIFVFEDNGIITQFTGNYSDFKESDLTNKESSSKEDKKSKDNNLESNNTEDRVKNRPLKFSYKEQKEYEQIDDMITFLEEQISDIDVKIKAAATDYMLLQQLMKEKEDLEKQLEEKMERWIYLNELCERIAKGQ